MRAYVDTNILVDLVLSRQEFLPNAQRVFARALIKFFLASFYLFLFVYSLSFSCTLTVTETLADITKFAGASRGCGCLGGYFL